MTTALDALREWRNVMVVPAAVESRYASQAGHRGHTSGFCLLPPDVVRLIGHCCNSESLDSLAQVSRRVAAVVAPIRDENVFPLAVFMGRRDTPAISKFIPLTERDAEALRLRYWIRALTRGRYQRSKRVSFATCDLTTCELEQVSLCCRHIQSLDVSFCDLGGGRLGSIRVAPLQSLTLSHAHGFTGDALLGLIDASPNLRAISLAFCSGIESATAVALLTSPQLTCLNLAGLAVAFPSGRGPIPPTLTSLVLSRCDMSDGTFGRLATGSRLSDLHIDRCRQLSDATIGAVLDTLTETLCVFSCADTAAAGALLALRTAPRLRSVDVSHTKCPGTVLADIVGMPLMERVACAGCGRAVLDATRTPALFQPLRARRGILTKDSLAYFRL